MGAPAEVAHARQAVLHVLRAGRDARAAPRAEGVGRQVPRAVRPGLGRGARGDPCPPEGARSGAARRGADRAARRHPGLGRHARRAQAGAGASDGGLRRVPGAHRSSRRPSRRHSRRSRCPRRHARVLHHRRQRRERRGWHQRNLQRAVHLQRRVGVRDRRVDGSPHRRVRYPERVQPLRGRLGPRDGHAVPMDQAGGVALGRHPQRRDRALAERVRGAR